MQATLGGATSGPVSGSSGANPPAAIPKHHRYSSRSNSFSSASIVTVKRTASLSSSSGTGARNSTAPMRAQSPGEPSVIALRVGREQLSPDQKRRKSVAIEPTERPNGDVLGTSHRHSHSTSSSAASVGNARRNRASSSALVVGMTGQGFSPKKRSAGTIDYSPRASLQRPPSSRSSSRAQQSPATSPEGERRRPPRPELTNPMNSLPSLHTTPGLANDTASPSTIQTIATPSEQINGPDYFWHENSSPENASHGPKLIMIRSKTAPVPAVDQLQDQAVDGAHEDTINNRPRQKGVEGSEVPQQRKRDDQQEDSKPINGKEHKKGRTRERGEKDKKLMLAKALQKANTAVLLDNAQNFEGALEAYMDACKLLQQVTERSSGTDDKRKLHAINHTYTTRIEELRTQIELTQPTISTEKSLPARPTSDDSLALSPALGSPTIESTLDELPATASVISSDVSRRSRLRSSRESVPSHTVETVPGSQDENALLLEPTFEAGDAWNLSSSSGLAAERSSESKARPDSSAGKKLALEVPALQTSIVHISPTQSDSYMPAPLSPRRNYSLQADSASQQNGPDEPEFLLTQDQESFRENKDNTGPSSWLDTIDENSSRTSSVHSISSQQGLHRKYLRAVSGLSSTPDFDAAFDAAVEAAYDQGLEPDLEGVRVRRGFRQSKRETKDSFPIRSSEINEISPTAKRQLREQFHLNPGDDEDEMLDEIAQDYAQSFNFDMSSKSALPRESGSSGYSRSTWQSSQVSDRTTAGTSLSTVAEDVIPHQASKNAFATSPLLSSPIAESILPPPSAPPPQTSLPKPPVAVQPRTSSVRNRRLSGQNLKRLKIETPGTSDARKRSSRVQSSSPQKENADRHTEFSHDFDFGPSLQLLSASGRQYDDTLNSPPSLNLPSATDDAEPTTSSTAEQRQSLQEDVGALRTNKPTFFKKTKSSDGLRQHMILLNSPTTDSGPSVHTPLSSTFMNFSSKRMNETPLTSQRATLPSFGATAIGTSYEGVFLFDTSVSESQRSSTPRSPNVPTGIEPCPESSLLRPFWLMRNLASTLTHPKGGFLTSRLFVPSEVWQIKSMKLKYLEDKIANCDLLTAALGRLAGVDTYDADAIMEELESFEDVLERVQNNLGKKLGSEVGTGGLNSLFKDASATAAAMPSTTLAPDGSEKVKGYLSSWRKLRQKSSGVQTVGTLASRTTGKTTDKEAFNMSTVPMTLFVSLDRRGAKKDVRNCVFDGPNKDYISSLARLFEGVQVLDQIARQVEDPGLRGTSQTHVGLELSIRHAAEFFSFYICRFVLADLGILIDKFLKRGTEWVLT